MDPCRGASTRQEALLWPRFCLLQADFAVLLYNLRSPHPNLPLFLPEISSRQQARQIINLDNDNDTER
jgi:hypothetical protein